MKNSLAVLLGDIDILQQKNGDDLLSKMRIEGNRLNDRFMQLLSIYRIENKQYALNVVEHSVYDMLEEVRLENESMLYGRSISLNVECDQSLLWHYDRSMVQGVINTLIHNAYRYAESEVLLRATSKDGMLKIDIMDDGGGYPMAMLDSEGGVAGIDFQAGNTGLGHYFARFVAEAHSAHGRHGAVHLSNNGLAHGACLSFILP